MAYFGILFYDLFSDMVRSGLRGEVTMRTLGKV